MKWLVNYFRELFCKHEWIHIRDVDVIADEKDNIPYRRYKVYMCEKCLYSKRVRV